MSRLLPILLAAALAGGCASSVTTSGKRQPPAEQRSKAAQFDPEERRIVSSAELRIKTDRPDSLHDKVIDLAARYEGYVLSSGKEATTIRIPAISFKDAIADIEGMGDLLEKNISGQDVTEQYRDLEIRLDNAVKTRDRYLALLDKAGNINEMVGLEKELERLNEKIETLKGKIERLAHMVEFSSITVRTSEEVRPGPVGYAFYKLYQGVKWLFVWD